MSFTYKAQQFIASPDAEMLGTVFQGMSENLRAEQSKKMLAAYGITEIDVDKWYPHPLSFDVAKAIHNQPNGTEVLVAMGRGIGETAALPSEINDVESFMAALPYLYQANIRYMHPEERFYVETLGEKHYKVINNTPSSNNLIYGMLWEFLRRYSDSNEEFSLIPLSGVERDAVDSLPYTI